MSEEDILRVAEDAMLRPRTQFRRLAQDHVPLDELTGTTRYEASALRELLADAVVAVAGPSGSGKSSVIASVCSSLPETHLALRVPVTGVNDPASVSEVAQLALSNALAVAEMEDHQREALESARADEVSVARSPAGMSGGKLGGGPIPAGVNLEMRCDAWNRRFGALTCQRQKSPPRQRSRRYARSG